MTFGDDGIGGWSVSGQWIESIDPLPSLPLPASLCISSAVRLVLHSLYYASLLDRAVECWMS